MIKIYDNIEINSDYDYYGWLKVDKSATTEEIIKAGEERQKELLSESVNMSGEDVATSYTLLNLAVKILSDADLRNAYDTLVEEVNNEVNRELLDTLMDDYQKHVESEKKDERIVELENEAEALRKRNESNEDYIRELERKLSIKNNELIDDYKEDEDFDGNSDEEDKSVNDDKEEDINKNVDEEDIKNNNDEENNEEDKKEEKEVEVDSKKVIEAIFHDTEEPQKVEEVEEVKSDSPIIIKGSVIASRVITIAVVAGVSILLMASCTANARKRAQEALDRANNDSYSSDDYESTETTIEEETSYEVETPVVEEVEPYEVELDVNSDAVILETVDKICNEVSKINDPVAKDMLNRETIEALVRYTRDNSILSGETAYELFATAYENGIDTSMFFENLDSYQTMNTLYLSTKAIDQNNNSYDDELNAYKAIDAAVDYLDENNYAAIWNVSSISDAATGITSMIMAADADIENGLEGTEYNNEENKVSENVRTECNRIYQRVRTDQDSYLRNLRWNALDNENVRTLG